MNIIHSFWSKPCFHEQQDYTNSRNMGGWPDIKYFWLSMAYSCYAAKRHHPKINLVTDDQGYEFAIKHLDLPYAKVDTAFNSLAEVDHRIWAIAKLSAYKCQTEPFVHIDNDVYLWHPVPTSVKPGFLVAQNRIQIPQGYRDTLTAVFEHFRFIPECIRWRGVPDQVSIISGGIVGGNDVEFFQEYCTIADRFFQENIGCLDKLNIGRFNAILDEYLFTCMVAEQNRDVAFMLNVPVEEGFESILRFNLIPFLSKYIHVVGFAKQNQYACEQLEFRFRYEFPKEYERICTILMNLYPPEQNDNSMDTKRWERAKRAFSVLYSTDVNSLLQRKVRLPKQMQVTEHQNEQGAEEYRITIGNDRNGNQKSWKLNEMDEALVYFQSPVCINELLEGLKAEGIIHDDASLAQYRFKLLDFVTEKITIDGVLEFV